MTIRKWIKVHNEKDLGPIIHSDENGILNFENQIFDENTSDEILIKHNMYKLIETILPDRNEIPYVITRPPIYKIAQDGTMSVFEEIEYKIIDIEDIRREKIQDLYYDKDRLLKEGVEYNGKNFDLRFRNLAHLSIISTLINFKKFPENFKWFTKDGELVSMSESDMLELIQKAAHKILEIEEKAGKVNNKISEIKDLSELFKFEPVIE